MGTSYLICAAGRGTRTASISQTTPKPLLKIEGKSFLRHSIESLPVQPTSSDQLIVLHSPQMSVKALAEDLDFISSRCEVILVEVAQLTRGQLETALLGLSHVKPKNSVAIFNADTFFKSSMLLEAMESQQWDGLIPCVKAEGNSWSFCAVADETKLIPTVTRVTEKDRISHWCSVGFYWFKNLANFQHFADLEITSIKNQEIYVAPMYNRLIAAGQKIGMPVVEEFKPMGSLEQIQVYWNKNLEQMKKENLS